MKLLKWIALSAILLLATVGASRGAPAMMLLATPTPARPAAVCPGNNAVVSIVTPPTACLTWPTFVWSHTAGAGGSYDIDIATDPGFTSIIDTATGIPENPAPALNSYPSTASYYVPGTYYYWRVQAWDSTHTYTSGFAVFTFRTAIAATSDTTPNPRLPGANAFLQNNLTNDVATYPPQAMFQWNPVLNATGFVLQVSQSPSFSSLIVNVSLSSTTTQYTPAHDLTPVNTTLAWRVETLGGVYGNTWSDTWSFTTANPTSVPTLVQPATNNLDTDFTPGLLWNAVALPGGTHFDSYEVQVWTDKSFTNLNAVCFDVDQLVVNNLQYQHDTNVTTAHLDVFDALTGASIGSPTNCPIWSDNGINSLPSNTTFYWRVRGESDDGGGHNYYSDWSSAFVLRTSWQEVLCSSLSLANGAISILSGGTLLNNQPTFSWTPVPGNTGYEIYISSHANFSNKVLDTDVAPDGTPETFVPRATLPPGVILYWRVRANAASYGPGFWSCPFSFTTTNQPSTPKVKLPKTGAVVTAQTPTAPTLVWTVSSISPSTTFAYYEVEVDTNTAFSGGIDDTTDATSQLLPYLTLSGISGTPLSTGILYYWRVRAFDTPGDYSSWSATSYFRTAVDIPTGLVSTPPGSPSQPVALTWNGVVGATGYTVQITEDPAWKRGIRTYKVGISPALNIYLPTGTTWYWRVQAVSKSFGSSPFTSGSDQFTMP